MRRRVELTIGIVAMTTVLATGLFAAKPPRETPLLVSFGASETDALRSDAGSPAPGFSADYADGLQNILAILQTSGNFHFTTQSDTRLPAERSVCFYFLPEAGLPPELCVSVNQAMLGYAGDVPIQSLRYGGSVAKLTRFTWQDGSDIYRLGYGTNMDMNEELDSPPVRVTCTAPANTSMPCATWLLAPETDGTAALFRFPLIPGKRGTLVEGPPEWLGNYTMPFVQTLTLKP